MLKEIVEASPKADVSVIIVWLPMIGTDNAFAAHKIARMFDDERALDTPQSRRATRNRSGDFQAACQGRVRQFYDPKRIVGLACVRDVFPTCLHDSLAATPPDHPIYADLKQWEANASRPRPLWDAVLFYDKASEWRDRVPTPNSWSKQVAFFGDVEPGQPTATFFHNDCKAPPMDSDWYVEVRNAMQAIDK